MKSWLIVLPLLCAVSAAADPVIVRTATWPVDEGGNGHSYQSVLVAGGVSWTDARDLAVSMGGHLATVTTSSESSWLFEAVVNDPSIWSFAGGGDGPWLGGYQDRSSAQYSEPFGAWTWVTGEVWSYANWSPGNPDNTADAQDFLQYIATWDGSHPKPTPYWDDHYQYGSSGGNLSLIVEYEVPSPGPAVLASSLAVQLCARRRRV